MNFLNASKDPSNPFYGTDEVVKDEDVRDDDYENDSSDEDDSDDSDSEDEKKHSKPTLSKSSMKAPSISTRDLLSARTPLVSTPFTPMPNNFGGDVTGGSEEPVIDPNDLKPKLQYVNFSSHLSEMLSRLLIWVFR